MGTAPGSPTPGLTRPLSRSSRQWPGVAVVLDTAATLPELVLVSAGPAELLLSAKGGLGQDST